MVLVIMGVLSALAAPRVASNSSFDQKGFKDQIKASIQFARKMAVARRRYVCVNLNTGNGGSALLKINTNPPESISLPVVCSTSLNLADSNCALNSVCAPDDVNLNLTSGPASFLFNTSGQTVDFNGNLLTGSPAISINFGEQSIDIEPTGLVR